MTISAALVCPPTLAQIFQIAFPIPANLIFGDYYLLVTLLSFIFIAGLSFSLWVKLFEKRPVLYPRILQRQLERRAVQELWSINSSLLCCDVDPHFDRILSIGGTTFTLCIQLCSSHYSVL